MSTSQLWGALDAFARDRLASSYYEYGSRSESSELSRMREAEVEGQPEDFDDESASTKGEVAAWDGESLRVRVLADVPSVQVSGTDITYDGFVGAAGSVRFKRFLMDEWFINGKRWKSKSFQEALRIKGHGLRINDKTVPNDIELKARSNGRVDVIAALPLDTYLVGVLAAEVSASWPIEALKAQAVVARSFTLQFLQSQKYKTFDIDSSQLNQVFRELGHKAIKEKQILEQAVRETKNQVLQSTGGRLASVHYHSDCGGVTESATAIWSAGHRDSKNLLNHRPVASCPLGAKVLWETYISEREIVAVLKKQTSLRSLFISAKLPSKRASTVTAAFADGTAQVIKADDFRKKFGYGRIKSAQFEVKSQIGGYVVKGRGFGHGVGLCQWGSKYLADQGRNYLQIIARYFPLAKIAPLSKYTHVAKNRL